MDIFEILADVDMSSPGKYVDRLKQYGVIIAPDYSQYYKFLYK